MERELIILRYKLERTINTIDDILTTVNSLEYEIKKVKEDKFILKIHKR